MSIGTTIKKLRRDRDITQEKLAEFLNISPQAVSRWETDLAMPDITLLPTLANVFNVTTDYLLGVDITKKQEKIDEYHKRAHELSGKGHTEEVIALWREALLKFPNDYSIMANLAMALYSYACCDDDKQYMNEALKLCEKIYEECTDDRIRNSTVQLLVFLNNDHLGNKEKAREYAERMPNMFNCSSALLGHVLVGDELLVHERITLDFYLYFIKGNIDRILCNKLYSIDEKIQLKLIYEKLFDIIYDGDLEEMRKGYDYLHIATLYAQKEDVENTLFYIEKSKTCAIEQDKDPFYNYKYTMKSLIFKGYVRDITYSKNYNYNESMNILQTITEQKRYDFIRDDKRFKDFVEELKIYAKYE